MIEAESEIVSESLEDMEENQTERKIVRTSEGNEQIGDDSGNRRNNVGANVETLDEETQLFIPRLNTTKNITQTKYFNKGAGVCVADQLGLKKYEGSKNKEPWWDRRIAEDIKQLKKEINFLDRVNKEQIGTCKEGKAKLVEETYGVKGKGLITLIEELKQRILVKVARISRYKQRIQQCRINRLFKVNQWNSKEFNGQAGSVVTEAYQMLKKIGTQQRG